MLLTFILQLVFFSSFFISWYYLLVSIPNVYGSGASPLSWKIRMKIAIDAAKGLAFLHSDEVNVMHGDFRTSNILIDSVSGLIDLTTLEIKSLYTS